LKKIRGITLSTALLSAIALITCLACIACNATAAEKQQTGTFKVVGVGPGDGDLLTLRAVKAIEDAEVVFCSDKKQKKLSSTVDFKGKEVVNDYTVLFWHYGKKCDKNAKKHFKQRMSCEEYHSKQAEFAQKVRKSVAEGKDVVMLSSGDPTIYGPDIWTLRELSELDTELIPGLSAFNAANAALEASLGEVIITAPFISKAGEQDTLEKMSGHDKATMVIFMPWDMKKTFKRLAQTYPEDTPAAVVSNAGMVDKEKAVIGTVGSFAADTKGLDGNRSIIYVGKRLKQAQFNKTPKDTSGKGKYYLVGMGPGDPDLATLRAMKVIEEADIIFSGERLRRKFAKELEGKAVITGYHRLFPYYGKSCSNTEDDDKRKNGMTCEEYHKKQQDFAARVRKAVAEGKTVAMIDSGDPLVYGPCSWSITELNDLKTEVIPGVSCFNASNAALKAGVTQGEKSHSVILASGWTVDEMARHQSTMVLFTMRNDFKKFIDTLTKYYTPDTPAAVVVRAGYVQDQRVIQGTLGTLLEKVDKEKLPFEYMLYVGDFLKESPDRIQTPTISQSF
ncbi:hypothetical protein VU04_04270, partial [Desulfobulbus sp. TB]|nr:hypothetical protein [Desulfobulbus sp. TB]